MDRQNVSADEDDPAYDSPPTLGPLSFESIPGGRYVLVERLSAGAVGSVYKALDTVLDRPVAVKSIRLDTPFAEQTADELRERFVREARIAARLHHPHIVSTHDIVATGDRGFIIMEFIEGTTLEQLVSTEGRLPLSKALHVVTQLASALHYAHSQNVVHRDVKPSNILVSRDLDVWITDFGIAKSDLSTNLTMAGGIIGTPDYMSPEQAQGEDVDARSDLFSVGCILFESALGVRPFRASSLTGVLLGIINDSPLFPKDFERFGMPPAIEAIFKRALEKAPADRFETGAELLAEIDAIPRESIQRADAVLEEERATLERRQPEERTEGENEVESATDELAEDDIDTQEVSTEAVAAIDSLPETGTPESADQTETTEAHDDDAESAIDRESDDADRVDASSVSGESGRRYDRVEDTEPARAEGDLPSRQEGAPELRSSTEESDSRGDSDGSRGDVRTESSEDAEQEPASEEDAEREKATASSLEEDSEPSVDIPADPKRVRELRESESALALSLSISNNLQGVEISPEEGFMLSRIDGCLRPRDIIAMSPLPDHETARTILDLLDKKLVVLEARETPSRQQQDPDESQSKGAPDDDTVAEIDRLLGLAVEGDFGAVLNVDIDAPSADLKSAYLTNMTRFHPDRFPGLSDPVVQGKLARLCAAFSEALMELTSRAESRRAEAAEAERARASTFANMESGKGLSPLNGSNGTSDDGSFDKRKYARELYDRALSAFELADYWGAVQLGQQAIEVDDTQADFYFLLGRALMQNRRWRKDAAQNFRRATELAPDNVEYLGTLGALYEREGLRTRAKKLLERLRVLDPEYVLPELRLDD